MYNADAADYAFTRDEAYSPYKGPNALVNSAKQIFCLADLIMMWFIFLERRILRFLNHLLWQSTRWASVSFCTPHRWKTPVSCLRPPCRTFPWGQASWWPWGRREPVRSAIASHSRWTGYLWRFNLKTQAYQQFCFHHLTLCYFQVSPIPWLNLHLGEGRRTPVCLATMVDTFTTTAAFHHGSTLNCATCNIPVPAKFILSEGRETLWRKSYYSMKQLVWDFF